jgi:hypothetical protein
MEVDPVLMLATCRTPGCPVEDRTYTVEMYPNSAEPIFRAQCGQCSNPVTDLVPA